MRWLKGTDLSDAEKQRVAEKLHEYTGLPVDYIIKADLRVTGGEFEKTLQDDPEGMTTGRLRHALPGSDPRSAKRERGIRSAERSDFVGICFATESLPAPDLKYGEGQTYLPRALFDGVGWNMVRQGSGGGLGNALGLNVSARPRRGNEDESAAEGDGERRLLRSGHAIFCRGV